jgi:hypothetical protein
VFEDDGMALLRRSGRGDVEPLCAQTRTEAAIAVGAPAPAMRSP